MVCSQKHQQVGSLQGQLLGWAPCPPPLLPSAATERFTGTSVTPYAPGPRTTPLHHEAWRARNGSARKKKKFCFKKNEKRFPEDRIRLAAGLNLRQAPC